MFLQMIINIFICMQGFKNWEVCYLISQNKIIMRCVGLP